MFTFFMYAMKAYITGNHAVEPRTLVYLRGELARRCSRVKKTTGISTAALVRTALLEWFSHHEGEPGVETI